VIALPSDVLAQLNDSRDPEVTQWALPDTELVSLLEALGRALSSSDLDGVVANSRIAFALGDAISYPKTVAEAQSLTSRNTAIVQRLERGDPVFGQVVSDLSRSTNRLVSISAYVSEVHSKAFSWHVDKWDNLVIQAQGRKAFEIEGGVTKELGPGDALFLPEDIQHRPRTIDKSVHLSVAFFPSGHSTSA
jgi:ribosomal protein L16 Arg81 hydroxylase